MNKTINMKNRVGEDAEWEFPSMGAPMLRGETVKIPKHFHRFRLDEEIKEPSYYRALISCLNDASEEDEIELILSTPGGSMESMICIMTAIENSEANVVATVTGQCASAGTFIMLSCPNVRIGRLAHFMFHEAYSGAIGKMHDIVNKVAFDKEYMDRLIRGTYKYFLSDEEIQQVIDGKELWFHADEAGKRLKVFFENKSNDIEAEMLEMQKELEALKDEASSVVEYSAPVAETPQKKPAAKKAVKKTAKPKTV